MVRARLPVILIALITLDIAAGELWCYQCNTDLREGHKGECNDPYMPGPPMDLAACPQNESHHCLKSVIFYRHVLVTVRGCVPSRKIEGYCQHEDQFPESNIECYFCDSHGCNGQGTHKVYPVWISAVLTLAVIWISKELT